MSDIFNHPFNNDACHGRRDPLDLYELVVVGAGFTPPPASSSTGDAKTSSVDSGDSAGGSGQVTVTTTIASSNADPTATPSKKGAGSHTSTTSTSGKESDSSASPTTGANLAPLYLDLMYQRASANCLYWHARQSGSHDVGVFTFNTADLALAATVPLLAAGRVKPQTTTLISGLLLLFPSQAKSLISGTLGMDSSGNINQMDYTATDAMLSHVYTLYSQNQSILYVLSQPTGAKAVAQRDARVAAMTAHLTAAKAHYDAAKALEAEANGTGSAADNLAAARSAQATADAAEVALAVPKSSDDKSADPWTVAQVANAYTVAADGSATRTQSIANDAAAKDKATTATAASAKDKSDVQTPTARATATAALADEAKSEAQSAAAEAALATTEASQNLNVLPTTLSYKSLLDTAPILDAPDHSLDETISDPIVGLKYKTYLEFKVALESACFSSLKYTSSDSSGGDDSKDSSKSSSKDSSSGGDKGSS